MQKHKLVVERGLGLRLEDQGPSFGPFYLVTQNDKIWSQWGEGGRGGGKGQQEVGFTHTWTVCEILFVMGTALSNC